VKNRFSTCCNADREANIWSRHLERAVRIYISCRPRITKSVYISDVGGRLLLTAVVVQQFAHRRRNRMCCVYDMLTVWLSHLTWWPRNGACEQGRRWKCNIWNFARSLCGYSCNNHPLSHRMSWYCNVFCCTRCLQ